MLLLWHKIDKFSIILDTKVNLYTIFIKNFDSLHFYYHVCFLKTVFFIIYHYICIFHVIFSDTPAQPFKYYQNHIEQGTLINAEKINTKLGKINNL